MDFEITQHQFGVDDIFRVYSGIKPIDSRSRQIIYYRKKAVTAKDFKVRGSRIMLKDVLSKANLILKTAQQQLTVQAAEDVAKVFNSIDNLNYFINTEIDRIEKNPNLSPQEKSHARRGVLEQAGRKLEIIKYQSNYSDLIQESIARKPATDEKTDNDLLQFLREREIRDRLFGMTESQILALFEKSLFDGSNQLLLTAILNAPPGFEMLSEPNLRKLRRLKENSLTDYAGTEREVARSAGESILDIFSLAQKELDRLRKAELSGSRINK